MHEVSVAKSREKENQPFPRTVKKRKRKTPSLSHLECICRRHAVKVDRPPDRRIIYLKQLRPLKENLKGALRAPCLSMTTPPPGIILVM